MIDGLMKSVFKFAGFSQEQAKEMIDGTFSVVQSIGNDMAQLKVDVAEIKAKLTAQEAGNNGKANND